MRVRLHTSSHAQKRDQTTGSVITQVLLEFCINNLDISSAKIGNKNKYYNWAYRTMTEPFQIYIQDVRYTGNSKQQKQSLTIILQQLFSDSYFTQMLLTVLPVVNFSINLVHKHFLTRSSNQAHANFGILGAKGSNYNY